MQICRMRTRTADQRGSVDRLAERLPRLGIGVVLVRTLESRHGTRTDDWVIEPSLPLDMRAIELAVVTLGAEILELEDLGPRRLGTSVAQLYCSGSKALVDDQGNRAGSNGAPRLD